MSQKKLDIADMDKYQAITNCYYKLIDFNIQNKVIESEEMKEHLFRPMQDSHKIYHWIHNYNGTQKLDKKIEKSRYNIS